MIRIEPYNPDSAIIQGFSVDADGLSGTDNYELDTEAAEMAIDRYLADRDRMYTDPPADLDGTISWLIHGLARIPWLWEDFHVYFLLAKLRLLLDDDPQAVTCDGPVDNSVDSAVAHLCTTYDVEYRPCLHFTNTNNPDKTLRSAFNAFGTRLPSPLFEVAAHVRLWLLYVLFVVFRPLVLELYARGRESTEVRIWLNAFKDHSHRFVDAPSELADRGVQVGFAVYDEYAMSGVTAFVHRGFEALRDALDTEEPIHVEWFATPRAFRRAIRVTPRVQNAMRRVAVKARNEADSPESIYLAKQVETISTRFAFQTLFMEVALQGFADAYDDDTWVHARPATKDLPRLMALIGDREDITTVAVAPHYYSKRRISSRFTEREINGPEARTLPDLNAVFEPLSAKRYREQGMSPSKIAVVSDKAESEARVLPKGGDRTPNPDSASADTPSPATPPSDGTPSRILVVLDNHLDNKPLVDAIERAIPDVSDVKLVFKPHPFYPPPDGLFEGLTDDVFEVTAPDASLADLVDDCDICMAVYSTATFPALSRAIPVVWVPFVSPNHIWMDLMEDVGIRTEDPEHLGDTLDRLINDERFYVEQARECERFAGRHLVPDADAPSLAKVLEETL